MILTVQDDGIGFDTDLLQSTSKIGCFGLFNIVRQIQFLSGEVMVDKPRDGGSIVTIQAPLLASREGNR